MAIQWDVRNAVERAVREATLCNGEVKTMSAVEIAQYNAALAAMVPHAEILSALTKAAQERFRG